MLEVSEREEEGLLRSSILYGAKHTTRFQYAKWSLLHSFILPSGIIYASYNKLPKWHSSLIQVIVETIHPTIITPDCSILYSLHFRCREGGQIFVSRTVFRSQSRRMITPIANMSTLTSWIVTSSTKMSWDSQNKNNWKQKIPKFS